MLYQHRDLLGASALHATSMQEAESIRAVGTRQPIAVIPNGIRCPIRITEKRLAPQKRALFLSRIHPKKGLLNLVHAWSVVRPKDWRMIIAGPDEGGHWRQVEEAIRKANLHEAFQYIGPVQDRRSGASIDRRTYSFCPRTVKILVWL